MAMLSDYIDEYYQPKSLYYLNSVTHLNTFNFFLIVEEILLD